MRNTATAEWMSPQTRVQTHPPLLAHLTLNFAVQIAERDHSSRRRFRCLSGVFGLPQRPQSTEILDYPPRFASEKSLDCYPQHRKFNTTQSERLILYAIVARSELKSGTSSTVLIPFEIYTISTGWKLPRCKAVQWARIIKASRKSPWLSRGAELHARNLRAIFNRC